MGMSMREERAQKIREKLTVFGQGKLQDLITLYDFLQGSDITLEDVRDYLEYTKEFLRQLNLKQIKIHKERQEKWNRNTRRCPQCMMPLGLRPITTPKGKANREGYTCHWYCTEETCDFEEYMKEDFRKIYKKIMGGR